MLIIILICNCIIGLPETFEKEGTKNKFQNQIKKNLENGKEKKEKGRSGGLERTGTDRNRERPYSKDG
jgi:hypothetical protein